MQRIQRERRGFTLLEILLVIAAIGILAAIVIVAINPNRQLGQARNSVRQSESNSIAKAIEQYAIDNEGAYPGGITGIYQDICPVGVSSNCVNLSTLTPNYIAAIPLDPSGGNYQVAINPSNGKVSLRSPNTEIGANIAVNPFTPTITFAKSLGVGSTPYSVASLANGGSIVSGNINGTATLGTGEPNQTILTGNHMFLAKYNANSTLAWAKRITTPLGYGGAYLSSTGDLPDGSTIVIGRLTGGEFVFGEGEINQTSIGNNFGGYSRLFMAKYNGDGTLVWARKLGEVDSDGLTDFYPNGSTSSDGSSIIVGTFGYSNYYYGTKTLILGQGEPNQTTLIAPNNLDKAFIAKYNADGTLAWAKPIGQENDFSNNYILSSSVSNSDGSSIVSGTINSSFTFGAGEPNATTLPTGDFTVKYNADGTLVWAKQSPLMDFPPSLILSDESYITLINFTGTQPFGSGEPNQTILTSVGGYDSAIVKYNANGTVAWARQFGGTGDDWNYSTSIAGFIDGSFIISGYNYGPNITFGAGDANPVTLTGAGSFIAKYNADGRLE